MPESAAEIVLHNYPQSPVAEKVRVALGIKGLSWRNVEIPRLSPKPMLTASPVAWLNHQLHDRRTFLLGSAPAAIDAQI